MKKIIYLIFIVMFLVGCSLKDNNEQVSSKEDIVNIESDKIDKEYTVDGIVVKIDSFSYVDGYSTIKLLINNTNDYSVYIEDYLVYVYDDSNNLIGSFNPIFDGIIKAGENTYQMFGVQGDFTEAYSIKYEFNGLKRIDD